MCEQRREHSGKCSFLQKHKILPNQRQRLRASYDSGFPSGKVMMNSVKAANHSLQIQKQQLIQGIKTLFHQYLHTLSARSERLCPNSHCSSCTLSFWIHACRSTDARQEAIPAGLLFPRAPAGSPFWPFSGPSLLDQMVPVTERRAHSKQLL